MLKEIATKFGGPPNPTPLPKKCTNPIVWAFSWRKSRFTKFRMFASFPLFSPGKLTEQQSSLASKESGFHRRAKSKRFTIDNVDEKGDLFIRQIPPATNMSILHGLLPQTFTHVSLTWCGVEGGWGGGAVPLTCWGTKSVALASPPFLHQFSDNRSSSREREREPERERERYIYI